MLRTLAMLMLGGMLWITAAHTASATVAVSVPNYPTVAQLEAGWNNAFIAILTAAHGAAPTITETVTYHGTSGEIYVVSKFTIGTINGSILGLAFDPKSATSLGSGNYRYGAAHAFRCENSSSSSCSAIRSKFPNGDVQEKCNCNKGKGGSSLIPINGQLIGTYDLNPANYSGLPTMN
ncbi:MAG: hypothetical protein IPM61_02540 [Chlorobi bacterium]|nr:MAG: hypothetical protein UZ07_CHB004000444 [Chlorobi bacterium OLB7]MBK8910184.1 hypothetical protein [Chlorobiota bacterium]